MKKNAIMILALVLIGELAVFADQIIVDHASGRLPACGPIQFVTSGTGTNTVLKVNSVQATNITATAINGASTIAGTAVSATTVSATTVSAATHNITGGAGTPSNVAGLITNGVASMTADATWLPIQYGGTNYWIPAFKKN